MGITAIMVCIVLFAFCAIFGKSIVNFFACGLMAIFLGLLCGVICGAAGYLLLLYFALQNLGFGIGFVVGLGGYIWLWR